MIEIDAQFRSVWPHQWPVNVTTPLRITFVAFTNIHVLDGAEPLRYNEVYYNNIFLCGKW